MPGGGWRYVAQALVALFVPDTCAACGRVLQEGDCPPLCAACRLDLSPTRWAGRADNPVELLFRGRYPVARAHAHYQYVHNTAGARAVLAFKYRHRPDVARRLAAEAAAELLSTGFFEGVDCLLPVPLALRRQWRRGYNQSMYLARGLQDVSGVPVWSGCVRRVADNPSQTHLTAAERRLNVSRIFRLTRRAWRLEGKHVMLVDDVLTTGATMCALADEVMRAHPAQLSVFALVVSPHVPNPHVADWTW